MILYIVVAVLCFLIGEGTIWLIWRRTRAAVKRDMAVWDAERAEQDRQMRENDAREDREFAEQLRRLG